MSKRFKISRNVFLLGIVSFFADLSSEIYFAILPFVILELGGSGLAIGLIAGVTDAFVSILKGIFGFLADRLAAARKKYVYWGYGLPATFKFLMAFSGTWISLLLFRLMERFGKGIRTAPRDAMIAEFSNKENIGRSFGFHRAMDSFGAFLGTLVALILVSLTIGYPTIFIISSAIGFLTLFPLYFVAESSKNVDRKDIAINFRDFRQEIDPQYWKLLLITVFHGLSLISYMFLVLLPGKVNFVLFSSLNSIQTGILMYMIFNLVYTIFGYFAGILADKRGRIFVLQLGSLAFIVALLVFLVVNSLFTLIIAFILYGISYGLTQGNFKAVMADKIPTQFKATGYGIFNMILGLSIFVGNVIYGVIFDSNFNLAIIISTVFAGITLILLKTQH
ncbi:MAG: MFS transporter [Candidatus Heimdallarchaeota archaeon]|nr:MFS transporter [Candidatus Heimdallarchaeota archaeon]